MERNKHPWATERGTAWSGEAHRPAFMEAESMLVLSRRETETIVLVVDGKRIVVTVVEIRESGNRVKLGVEAPADVHILRGELDICED